jgi:phospholipase/carboxylesterase
MIVLAPDSRSDRSWDLMTTGRVDRDVRFLDRALRHVFERCRIDPSHIALGGFSDGATYALSLGVSNGDLFTHLIAHSPGYIVPFEPLVGKPPIFVSHGTTDSVLPVEGTRSELVPLLRDSGYEVTYEEFDGGHTVPAEISEKTLNWFLG